MAFINSYKPPSPPSYKGYYGPDPYDINFVFPIDFTTLQTQRVKMTPFIPSIHAEIYVEQIIKHPELQMYYPFVHHNIDDVLTSIETWMRPDSGCVFFAIIDKETPDNEHPEFGGSMAGVMALIRTSEINLSTEIGWVMTFPAFQRSYVTSNAIGILLKYCLDLPEASPPGLGLRRVQWTANPSNHASIKAAQRMGLKLEGTLRWTMVLPEGAIGSFPRKGGAKASNPGRGSVMLALCADDWENGAREHVQQMIDRV